MSGISQASDSATSESGISGALYKPDAVRVGNAATVAEGFGVVDGIGEGKGSTDSGVLVAQETTITANSRVTRMRARFVIGGVLIYYGGSIPNISKEKLKIIVSACHSEPRSGEESQVIKGDSGRNRRFFAPFGHSHRPGILRENDI